MRGPATVRSRRDPATGRSSPKAIPSSNALNAAAAPGRAWPRARNNWIGSISCLAGRRSRISVACPASAAPVDCQRAIPALINDRDQSFPGGSRVRMPRGVRSGRDGGTTRPCRRGRDLPGNGFSRESLTPRAYTQYTPSECLRAWLSRAEGTRTAGVTDREGAQQDVHRDGGKSRLPFPPRRLGAKRPI